MKTIVQILMGLILFLSAPNMSFAEKDQEGKTTEQLQAAGSVEEQDFLASYGVTSDILNTLLIVFGIGGIFGLVVLAWTLSGRKTPDSK